MRTITALPTVATPSIAIQSRWTDEVQQINFRVLSIHPDGIQVRCVCTAASSTGKVWEDRVPRECFGTELTPVG